MKFSVILWGWKNTFNVNTNSAAFIFPAHISITLICSTLNIVIRPMKYSWLYNGVSAGKNYKVFIEFSKQVSWLARIDEKLRCFNNIMNEIWAAIPKLHIHFVRITWKIDEKFSISSSKRHDWGIHGGSATSHNGEWIFQSWKTFVIGSLICRDMESLNWTTVALCWITCVFVGRIETKRKTSYCTVILYNVFR